MTRHGAASQGLPVRPNGNGAKGHLAGTRRDQWWIDGRRHPRLAPARGACVCRLCCVGRADFLPLAACASSRYSTRNRIALGAAEILASRHPIFPFYTITTYRRHPKTITKWVDSVALQDSRTLRCRLVERCRSASSGIHPIVSPIVRSPPARLPSCVRLVHRVRRAIKAATGLSPAAPASARIIHAQ